MCVPYPDVFSIYTNLSFHGGPYHDIIWALATAKMKVETFFAFLTTAGNEVLDAVAFEDDPQVVKQPSVGSVPLSGEVRKGFKEIGVLALLCESDYDALYGYVAFKLAEEVLRSDEGTIGWFT